MADSNTLTLVFGAVALGLSAFTVITTRERKGGSSDQELASLASTVADLVAADRAGSEWRGGTNARVFSAEAAIAELRAWRHTVNGNAASLVAEAFMRERDNNKKGR